MSTHTVTPLVSFTGYPDGLNRVAFVAGQESAPVPSDYADLLVAKGLVEQPALAPSKKSTKTVSAPDADPKPETTSKPSGRPWLGGGLSGAPSISPDTKD